MKSSLKVAVVWPAGGADKAGLGQFFLRAFNKLSVDATGGPVMPYDRWSPFGRAWATEAGRKYLLPRRLRYLRDTFRARDVSFVLVIKGEELDASHVQLLRPRPSACVALYHPDNPIWQLRPFDPSFAEAVRAYDLVCTFAKIYVPVFQQVGAKEVLRIPFGFASDTHMPVTLSGAERDHYQSDVSYAGNTGPLQRYWMGELSRYRPKTFGAGWEQHRRTNRWLRQLKGYDRYVAGLKGFGNDLTRVCAGAKVVVNLVRAETDCVHSMKTFELPACGGCVLTNRTEEQLEFFPEGCAYFSSKEELLSELDRLLGDERARRELAERGRAEAQPHTYEARARQLLEHLGA